jgi:pterin-4a-carbinolamine dehydratase
MSLAFINYRRLDTSQAAQALYAQLRERFGPAQVFLDVRGFQAGEVWPDRLRSYLSAANLILVVIGPRWLKAVDNFERRRIDDENDWVRNEILYAIENQIPIIPILVAGAETLPPKEGLPKCLHDLLTRKSLCIRDEKWDRDLGELIEIIETQYGFIDNQTSVIYPRPEVKLSPLTSEELDNALSYLIGWQPIESTVPREYPKSRQELRKVYQFKSFKAAIDFMSKAVSKIVEFEHHPRWENQWKTVTVYLSTWDIGHRISQLDIKLAEALDLLYSESIKSLENVQ